MKMYGKNGMGRVVGRNINSLSLLILPKFRWGKREWVVKDILIKSEKILRNFIFFAWWVINSKIQSIISFINSLSMKH